MIISSEGESEDKNTDDLSAAREKVKINRQMFIISEGESENKKTLLSAAREKVKIKRQLVFSSETQVKILG